jgi:cyclohexyl-isocyanide hydratase
MHCHLIGPGTDRVVTSWEGVPLTPTATFDDPPKLDMLFVPGGSDLIGNVIVPGQLGHNPYLDFLAAQANTQWICSVCSGALLLAAAGLLRGYTCTTHWAFAEVLRLFPGVTVVNDYPRYVRDRNRVTGAGVSSGIDQSLYLTSEIAGPDVARLCQLKMQYRPDPVLHGGDPGDTDVRDQPELIDQVHEDWHIDRAGAAVGDWLAKAP